MKEGGYEPNFKNSTHNAEFLQQFFNFFGGAKAISLVAWLKHKVMGTFIGTNKGVLARDWSH